ncbi:MAG: prephenate dehydratase [Anaeroplasma sp.]
MKKLAVLGPSGTYSDIAARKYILDNDLDLEITYYPSIVKSGLAVDDNTMAILPFENTLDGFVLESLDVIINKNYHIISQMKLNIDFAFVSYTTDINEITDVYCQFKAYGQCLDFINKYSFNIINTQSNSQTVQLINNSKNYGAIIPVHSLKDNHYPLEILHIADSQNNETRFFIVSNDNIKNELNDVIEASLIIVATQDRPGMLYDILKEFHDLNINLKSILSRPMKTEMGKYKFYIECKLKKDKLSNLDAVANRLNNEFIVNILGVYNAI